jgi:AbrB family looped-hinge helix DNA binding protein
MNVRLSQKGWIVIPAALREKYGLKPGIEVRVVDYGGVISIVPVQPDAIHIGAGLLRGEDSLTQAIVEEHRREQNNDKNHFRAG